MSFGSFLWGVTLAVVGYYMVSRTDWFINQFGDLASVFGTRSNWLSWRLLGTGLIFFGTLMALGLIELFFESILGGVLPK